MSPVQNSTLLIESTNTVQHQVTLPNNILFIEAAHVYIKVYQTDGKRKLIRHSLTSFLDQLPANLFVQTHRGFIVNLSRVTEVGNDCLYLGTHSVPVSRSRWSKVIKTLKDFSNL